MKTEETRDFKMLTKELKLEYVKMSEAFSSLSNYFLALSNGINKKRERTPSEESPKKETQNLKRPKDKEEPKEEIKEEANEENKDKPAEENKDAAKNEVKDTVKEELKDKDKNKDEIKVKEEIKEIIKENLFDRNMVKKTVVPISGKIINVICTENHTTLLGFKVSLQIKDLTFSIGPFKHYEFASAIKDSLIEEFSRTTNSDEKELIDCFNEIKEEIYKISPPIQGDLGSFQREPTDEQKNQTDKKEV